MQISDKMVVTIDYTLTITELAGFTKTFFAKHTLLNVLTRYCVFDVDRKLLVMRPYQIVAAECILQRIATATNHRQLGTLSAGGYIWHTTGSGKTLTSFKAAQLARGLPEIDKVLFVVDRKDLDYQTMREYERFEKGAANSNASTAVLQKQLEDPNSRIIITTIQKLSRFVVKNKKHPVYDAHVVVIFDECHRSQFGDMHTEITRVFKRYHLFGFTGTPIFAENAGSSGSPQLRTTQQAFGDKLHTYTIVDAINDKNVLPFRIDYINTIKTAPSVADKKVSAIDTERALLASERIAQIVAYIREHFDQKTKRSASYRHDGKRLALLWRAPRPAPRLLQPESLAVPLRTPAFRRLLLVYLVNGVASAVPATLVLFFIRDRLQAPTFEPLFLASYFAAGALSMPLWVRAVARFGLARCWLAGMLLAIASFAWAALLGAGDVAGYTAVCIASGLALGADLALPGALLAGVIQRAGHSGRLEGAYFGWWNFATKLNLALAAGIALPLLALFGYTPGDQQRRRACRR